MSNFRQNTKHPVTGDFEWADWLDNYFGPHKYGVMFPDGKIFNPEVIELEVMKSK